MRADDPKVILGAVMTRLETRFEMTHSNGMTPTCKSAYMKCLAPLAGPALVQAVEELLIEDPKWCPTDGQIQLRVTRILSPLPDVQYAWQEVMRKSGRRTPQKLSHTLIEQVVDSIGGLDSVYDRTHSQGVPEHVLYRRFEDAWNIAAQRWTVQAALALSRGERPEALFPGLRQRAIGQVGEVVGTTQAGVEVRQNTINDYTDEVIDIQYKKGERS